MPLPVPMRGSLIHHDPIPSVLMDIDRLDTEALPKGPCLGGIRSNILYPT